MRQARRGSTLRADVECCNRAGMEPRSGELDGSLSMPENGMHFEIQYCPYFLARS